MTGPGPDPMPFFVVQRETHEFEGRTCRFLYVDRCPHGSDLGALEISESGSFAGPGAVGSTRRRQVWEWHDLGNGRCRIHPSLLVPGLHGGQDCHFGPGEFDFMWLEPGELRNTEPFATRYRARTGREP